jgi:four helix bundle protein
MLSFSSHSAYRPFSPSTLPLRGTPAGLAGLTAALRPVVGLDKENQSMTSIDQLRVYYYAREACARAYRMAADIAGDPALRDQIRRAATSVVLNIAEGRGRGSDADFARFLIIARGSNTELAAQLTFAADLGLLEATQVAAVIEQNTRCGKMLSALIARLRAG